MIPCRFWFALAVLGLLLTVTVVPGVFTIDEDNYLVQVVGLQHGRLTVPGTEGLPPSPELAWFDPHAHVREVETTPVASTAPPLYAPLALPFSYLGWRGLVFLQTLAFLAAAVAVFLYAQRWAERPETPWLAAAAFALAGYGLEYAQGLWPHMATVAAITISAYLAARVRQGASLVLAVGAGLAAGLATGMRYQNVLAAVLVGAGVFLWAPRRWQAGAAYGAGLAAPLAASSLLNHARWGRWNPVSKGPGYFSRGGGEDGGPWELVAETSQMFWARVVDYATRPAPPGLSGTFLTPDPDTGAYLLGTAVKKAWLQSSPWLLPALVLLLLSWWPKTASTLKTDPERRRELRALALVIFPVLGAFAVMGSGRTDGFSFNQRYFLELVPLGAVAFAWSVESVRWRWRHLAFGAGMAALGALAALQLPPGSAWRQEALLTVPLVLAVALLGVWALDRRGRGRPMWTGLAAGLCLGWAFSVHVGDDLASSRGLRRSSLHQLRTLEPAIPDGAAVFAYWGNKDAFGPLLLDRNVTILDPFADEGEDAPALVTHLLAEDRRVFIVASNFPRTLFEEMRAGRTVTGVVRGPPTLVEIHDTTPEN